MLVYEWGPTSMLGSDADHIGPGDPWATPAAIAVPAFAVVDGEVRDARGNRLRTTLRSLKNPTKLWARFDRVLISRAMTKTAAIEALQTTPGKLDRVLRGRKKQKPNPEFDARLKAFLADPFLQDDFAPLDANTPPPGSDVQMFGVGDVPGQSITVWDDAIRHVLAAAPLTRGGLVVARETACRSAFALWCSPVSQVAGFS